MLVFLIMVLDPFTPGHFPLGGAFLLNTVLSCRITALTSAQQQLEKGY